MNFDLCRRHEGQCCIAPEDGHLCADALYISPDLVAECPWDTVRYKHSVTAETTVSNT